MADRGRSLFSLYVLYRIKKTLLSLISLKLHAWSEPNFVSNISVQGEWIVKSYWTELFPLLQPATESLKIFFSKSSEQILKLFSQKSSSVDCLSDLYKLCWYLKNMAARGRSLFSLFILYRKTKTLLSLIDSSLYLSADSNQKSSPEIILSILPINHFTWP